MLTMIFPIIRPSKSHLRILLLGGFMWIRSLVSSFQKASFIVCISASLSLKTPVYGDGLTTSGRTGQFTVRLPCLPDMFSQNFAFHHSTSLIASRAFGQLCVCSMLVRLLSSLFKIATTSSTGSVGDLLYGCLCEED